MSSAGLNSFLFLLENVPSSSPTSTVWFSVHCEIYFYLLDLRSKAVQWRQLTASIKHMEKKGLDKKISFFSQLLSYMLDFTYDNNC